MQHKKLAAMGLSLALAASMTVPALAAEDHLLIAPNPNAYRYSLTVNGEAVDTSGVPNIDGLPVRLVAEADHGSASWFAGESTAYVSMSGSGFTLDFADASVLMDNEKVEGAALTVVNGVSFLPVSFFDSLEGVDVTVNEETNTVDIVTPNNAPLMKAAYSLAETADIYGGMSNAAAMEQFTPIHADNFADGEVTGIFPMNITPDTMIFGKLAEGKEDALKAEWDAYVQAKHDTFSWYLSYHLFKVEDARFEVENGYVLCLIAENADEAVAAFREVVKDL